MEKRTLILFLLLTIIRFSAFGQEEIRKPYQFEIGVSPFSGGQSEYIVAALSLGLVGDVSNRFQWMIDFYSPSRTESGDLEPWEGTIEVHSKPEGDRNYSLRNSFSFSGKYYITKDKFSGHYAMFRVHNIWAQTFKAGSGYSGGWESQFVPMHGIYYGYKVEASDLFFDVSAGVIPHQLQINQVRPNNYGVVMLRMVMGFRIPIDRPFKK